MRSIDYAPKQRTASLESTKNADAVRAVPLRLARKWFADRGVVDSGRFRSWAAARVADDLALSAGYPPAVLWRGSRELHIARYFRRKLEESHHVVASALAAPRAF